MRRTPTTMPEKKLPIDTALLKPGMRLAVGLSGGADSVALLRALAARSAELGLVVHAAHLHHGLRGDEADEDLKFARELAAELGVPFHEARVDTREEAKAVAGPGTDGLGKSGSSKDGSGKEGTGKDGCGEEESGKRGLGKGSESIETAARRLRYGWFRELMARGEVDCVATAHTRDDQAETVLGKFLRGAWTEGLSGIFPVLEFPEGRIVRPLLEATRAEVEAYLNGLGQGWREDSSNRDPAFTRNRLRHELLPLLEGWNPRVREHLAQMAALARDEEAWWQGEVAKLGPQMVLTGRAVRGGGRAAGGEGIALDVTRLVPLAAALQRRILRYAAGQLGATPDFAATEALRTLALTGRAGQKLELAQGLRAERTPRELRLARETSSDAERGAADADPEVSVAVPGEVVAAAFGLRLRIEVVTPAGGDGDGTVHGCESRPSDAGVGRVGKLRPWRAGDRVRLRYSSGPRKVKEVLERLRVTGSGRAHWPVLEVDGRIVWMKGVEVEPEGGIRVVASSLEGDGA